MEPFEPSNAAGSGRKRKTRGKGLRVRTGCQACRARHIKCDEARPKCGGCQKSGRECGYPNQQPDAGGTQERQDGEHRSSERHHTDLSNEPQEGDHRSFEPPILDQEPEDHQTLDHGLVSPLASGLNDQFQLDGEALGTSPESAWSGWQSVSAEAASLRWFGLVATDAIQDELAAPNLLLTPSLAGYAHHSPATGPQQHASIHGGVPGPSATQANEYTSQDDVVLADHEIRLFRHFVLHLSGWIDVTDPDRYFAVVVPDMALRNRGLMTAILALSARHLSLNPASVSTHDALLHDRTVAVQYYNDTLRYLQEEMKNPLFLRSDELLATVLTISTYEMIDGSGRGWERHLKGVFWIQRSQLIQGESGGLKQRIWWAWLRQDIWVAFKERRPILSYYNLTRACSTLDFWELVNRAVYLLGQCVNYASSKEENAGRTNMQARLDRSTSLWESLEEWWVYFAKYDRRLPTTGFEGSAWSPIWINPPAASLAVQVYHFSKLLLFEYTPASGGLKELEGRQLALRASVGTICGIACCTQEDGPTIVSLQCLYAAGRYVKDETKRAQVIDMLERHRKQTGWPHYDIGGELRQYWTSEAE